MLKKLDSGSYFGQTRSCHERQGLLISETCFAGNLVIPPHEHANAFFCFVASGRGTRSWPGRAGAEAPMDLTLFPAGVPHANCWHGAGGRALHVEFTAQWLERLGAHAALLQRPGDFARGPPLWLARRLTEEAHCLDDAAPLAMEGLVLELLASCSRAASAEPAHARPAWLNRVRGLLDARFAEQVSLAEIAAAVHVSADHLSRVFRRHFGCSVGDYVRRRRLDFAAAQLAGAAVSLAEVAQRAGFADQSHFTRLFRRELGCTPAQYRASHARGRFRSKGSRLDTSD